MRDEDNTCGNYDEALYSRQHECNIGNKIQLFEAVQEINKPIRRFESRLRILAYACDLTTRCPSQPYTAANTEAMILLAMVKGLVNVDIQAELLAEVEQMNLENSIAFVEIRESGVVAAFTS